MGTAEDGFDRLYETARALGEETRFRIYRRLCLADEPVGVSDLASSFSLHPNAVRQHLSRLEQAGLAVSRIDREGTGAGRPRRLYELGPDRLDLARPPRTTGSLVTLLAEAVEALPSQPAVLVDLGRRWGRTWAARRKRENGGAPRSPAGRANALARELREWGWRPETRRMSREIRVATGRCLFQDRDPGLHGRCCELEEGLLTGLAEVLANGHARVIRTRGCRLEVAL